MKLYLRIRMCVCVINWRQIDNLCLVNIAVRHRRAWIQGHNFRTNKYVIFFFFACRATVYYKQPGIKAKVGRRHSRFTQV